MQRFKRVGIATVAVAALVVSAGLIGALGGGYRGGGPAAADEPSNQRSITVTGEGRVLTKPDTAQVSLGVQISNADLTAAQDEANRTMDAVIAAVKGQGVSEDRIKTSSYNIAIQRDYEKPDQPVTGYQVMHLIEIKVSPIDTAGAVIDAAVASGANLVNGVSFTLEDQDAAVRQARQQAIESARAKAEQLASLTGVSLGMPLTISEASLQPPPPIPMRSAADSGAIAGGAVATDLQGGQTEIAVDVTVSYAIQ